MIDINDFSQERTCVYEGETYSVRDNGAVMRHARENGRKRIADNIWTFGKTNSQNPYLLFGGVRVHRIVATAFLGNPPDASYVVDHKDTNCRNNRPENLQWLTRVENVLKNPASRKKIEFLCGVEEFIKNPAILRTKSIGSDKTWMRSVSKEEAENCRIRMELWAREKKSSKLMRSNIHASNFRNRVYKPLYKWEAGFPREPGLDFADTPWCAQYMWGDVQFPCCPQTFGEQPMQDYFNNINVGDLFAFNQNDSFPRLYAYEKRVLRESCSWTVICNNSEKNWNVVGVEMNEKNFFIHFNLGTFSSLEECKRIVSMIEDENYFWSKGFSCRWVP